MGQAVATADNIGEAVSPETCTDCAGKSSQSECGVTSEATVNTQAPEASASSSTALFFNFFTGAASDETEGEITDVSSGDRLSNDASGSAPATAGAVEAETKKDVRCDPPLPPGLLLQVEGQTSSTVDTCASELSSRSSAGLHSPPCEVDDERVGDGDVETSQGAATQKKNLGDCAPPLEVGLLAAVGDKKRSSRPSEMFVSQMLSGMHAHLVQIRQPQQWMVQAVEQACVTALGKDFKLLRLVGSVALCVETPGSDVDVVCFTHPNSSNGTVGQRLRLVREALQKLLSNSPYAAMNSLSFNLIEDARVPILRVTWMLPGHSVAVDVLVDQPRPVDHVEWFQRVGAVPSPSAILASGAAAQMPISLALRCLKWWIRRRQLPSTKEGGLPTVAWLLLALHACPAQKQTKNSEAAVVAYLSEFFLFYAPMGGLDGTLVFNGDEGDSEFKIPTKLKTSPWSELSIIDPTMKEGDHSELAPKMGPATQLLIHYELRRAAGLLSGRDVDFMRKIFDPVAEDMNSLPVRVSGYSGTFAAIVLLCDPSQGVGKLELANVVEVNAHKDWKAAFLHRSDTRSEMDVRILELDPETGLCTRRNRGWMVLCPCHFVCRARIEKVAAKKEQWWLNGEDKERFLDMQRHLRELREHHEVTVAAPAEAPTDADVQ